MNPVFELIEEIKHLNLSTEEGRNEAACKIKKMNHAEKLDVYHGMFMSIKYGPRKPRAFKKHIKNFIKNELQIKIKTHKEFTSRSYRRQIYGLFDWRK